MDYKKKLDDLINEMDSRGGSDLHFNCGLPPSIRVDGDLVFLTEHEILKSADIENFLLSLLTEKGGEAFHLTHDLDFAYLSNNSVRLRGNAYIEKGQPAIALRRVPKVRTINELNLPEKIREFALAKQGLFLIVGPIGQGKSTTMAAMIEEINMGRAAHIVTIEDPVEFTFENKKSIIDQREVGIDTDSFESAMKSVFREDVNVILIGEMRTHETIAAAVTAAETGHLVISTLHTNNASQSIDRIIDSFPSDQQDQIRAQLAGSLIGILSQRLIPKMNGGRVMAYELLVSTPAVANLIREKRTHELPMVIETGTDHGMVDMNRILLDLVQRDVIALGSAIEYSPNPNALRSQFK